MGGRVEERGDQLRVSTAVVGILASLRASSNRLEAIGHWLLRRSSLIYGRKQMGGNN